MYRENDTKPTTLDIDAQPWREEIAKVNNANRDSETIKIGVLTPLSAPGDAFAGNINVRGARLGVQYVREHGGLWNGKQLSMVVENDQATAAADGMMKSAVGGLAKLVIVDEVLATLGQWQLRTSPWVIKASEQLGAPIFAEVGHNDVTKLKYSTLFRTYVTIENRVPILFSFIKNNAMKRVAVISSNTNYGKMFWASFEAYNKKSKMNVDALNIEFDQETTTDLRNYLNKAKEYKPDVIINNGVVRTNYLIIKQAAEIGLLPDTQMMTTYPFPTRSDQFWEAVGRAGVGMVWPGTTFRPGMPGLTPIGQWFVETYLHDYGTYPPDNALNAFTDVTIIGQALNQAKSEKRSDLIEALETYTFDTWRGKLAFRRESEHWHHSPPEVVMMQYTQYQQDFKDARIILPEKYRTGDYMDPQKL